jgi:hypothetical protein
MKLFTSLFLLSILALPLSIKTYLYIDYTINKEEITQKYCENKDKPEMECNGCCHLNKELNIVEKAEESENSSFPISKISKQEIQPFLIQCIQKISFSLNDYTFYSNNFGTYSNLYSFLFFAKDNKPPISIF